MELRSRSNLKSLADPAQLGGGLVGPKTFDITWTPNGEEDDIAAEVECRVEFTSGRYVATEVKVTGVDGNPVTADTLRQIPVQELVSGSVWRFVLKAEGGYAVPFGFEFDPEVTKQGPTDEALRAVAAVYRIGYAAGDRPTQTVSRVLALNPNTAARWVMRAREKGFLPPTQKGRAGA